MQLKIYHRTEYHYHSPVHDSLNELKLSPRDSQGQVCKNCLISFIPPVKLSPYVDLYGNPAHHFEIKESHSRLVVEARMRMETATKITAENLPYGVDMSTLKELEKEEACRPFLQSSPYVDVNPSVWREAVDMMDGSSDVFQTAYAIMAFIFKNYSYDPSATVVTTHANEVIKKRQGVCQDFAHAMVALCRSLNMPARYVSGYFFDTTRDNSLRGSEATHAWVEIFVKGHGWIGLDPTNNKVIDDTYVVLATGRDYTDVAPISGSYYGGSTSKLKVHVTVRRVD